MKSSKPIIIALTTSATNTTIVSLYTRLVEGQDIAPISFETLAIYSFALFTRWILYYFSYQVNPISRRYSNLNDFLLK